MLCSVALVPVMYSGKYYWWISAQRLSAWTRTFGSWVSRTIPYDGVVYNACEPQLEAGPCIQVSNSDAFTSRDPQLRQYCDLQI